jgi:hypothetical protein
LICVSSKLAFNFLWLTLENELVLTNMESKNRAIEFEAFIFNSLNPEELKIIMLAFRSVICKAGDVVITEGESGEDLYCV